MQGEQDAALQSLNNAEQLLSRILDKASRSGERLQDSTSEASSTSYENTQPVATRAKSSSLAAEQTSIAVSRARTLLGKVLLAKASIYKQLKHTHEATECMKSAKKLDPALGKYVKD